MEKLYIWGENIPFNSERSKLKDMDIHEEYTMEDIFSKHPGIFARNTDFVEDMSGNDTLVYKNEILKSGLANETYTDKPFLIPYIVPGSDRCVICCPGGGYLEKSMDNEGVDIASFLNKAGISCFVLWYRSYPYRTPVMFMDCQRAIRYVRYHAKEYGINEEKIGIVGFSAGGNLCGTTVEIFRDKNIEAPGYISDEIDKISAHVNAMGLVYPATTFEYSKIFLEGIEDKEKLRNLEFRNKLAEYYTLKNHVKEGDPATFLCSALDDDLIPALQICEYAAELKAKNVPCEIHVFEYGGHGFGACNVERINEMFPKDLTRVNKWMDLFTSWINERFDKIK